MHTFNLSTREAETSSLREFKADLVYIESYEPSRDARGDLMFKKK